jgi:hypothetical protein
LLQPTAEDHPLRRAVEVTEEVEPEQSQEQKLREAQKAIVGDVPLIPTAPDTIVRIPRGIFTSNKWETEVEVRELTGADEEAMARFKEAYDFFNGILVYGITRIGSTDLSGRPFSERSSTLAGLLIGEREQLFIHIARVTYGDEKVITHTCPFCGVEADTTLLLSEDIPFPEMDSPQTTSFTMTTNKNHILTYRLATGADQMLVFSKKGANPAEQNTIMLSQCITQVDGEPVVSPLDLARGLSIGDRRKLLEELAGHQPSPDFNLKLDCVSCGEEMTLPITWQDIFRYQ